MDLKPAERIPLSQVVLDQLLEQIRDGSIRPGDRLPGEYELMRRLRVGRSSVREALRGLITLGLVDTRPGRGAVVAAALPNPLAHIRSKGVSIEHVQTWAILDLLEVRECLEGQAAQLAAKRATPSDLASIQRWAQDVEAQIEKGYTYFRANYGFHIAVARASHNSVLAESVRNLVGEVRSFREHLMREVAQMPTRDVLEHGAIVQAIRTHNPDRARRCMVRHLRSFARVVRSFDRGMRRDPLR